MSWEETFAEDMDAKSSARKRTVTVGWAVRAPHAHMILGAAETLRTCASQAGLGQISAGLPGRDRF